MWSWVQVVHGSFSGHAHQGDEIETYYRESGAGPGVVCLHSNASSSSQWRALMEHLAPNFYLLAPDAYGAGKGPPWPGDRTLVLRDEVALLDPVITRAGEPCVLVGHSYGAAVALVAAVLEPSRFRALVMYEPTLFSLVDSESPPPNEVDGIRMVVAQAAVALAVGNHGDAAEHFIDYWMGAGSWAARTEAQRKSIEAAIVNVQGWSHALLHEPTPLAAFATLQMPALLMVGKDSPESSRAVARRLVSTMPRLRTIEFEGLGHMGPITHPGLVNAAIDEFLRSDAAT